MALCFFSVPIATVRVPLFRVGTSAETPDEKKKSITKPIKAIPVRSQSGWGSDNDVLASRFFLSFSIKTSLMMTIWHSLNHFSVRWRVNTQIIFGPPSKERLNTHSDFFAFLPAWRLVNTPRMVCHHSGWSVYPPSFLGVPGVTVGWPRTKGTANNERVHSFCGFSWIKGLPFIQDLWIERNWIEFNSAFLSYNSAD